MQLCLEILFWCSLAVVIYTYIGYAVILYILVKIKELFVSAVQPELPEELPDVTLFIAAYNEEEVIEEKMANCYDLDYPKDKLKILWVTDGSTDSTNDKLAEYPGITVLYQPQRNGKTAALNRGVPFVKTPFTVFTDANTMLNRDVIKEMIRPFGNARIGCVAGEKRIAVKDADNASSGGEGFYWKYESKLKAWDARLYSAVGAAGELFAIRTDLFEPMPQNTLLDDFILSMRIAEKGYKIAYSSSAYALETGSADIKNEEKRKVRIAAGGLQAIIRLRSLLIPNPFRLGLLRFQYLSHRVLRWSIAPVLLFLLFLLNLLISCLYPSNLYAILLGLQILFYLLGAIGAMQQKKHIKNKILFIPYYFLFMNLNVLKGFFYLRKKGGKGTWEKAQRA